MNEHSPLLTSFENETTTTKRKGLTLFFGTVCLVDIFGVFPIVALPKAVLQCGWLGIPLVLFIIFIQMYTAILLGKCWILAEYLDKKIVEKNRYPYAALADLAFGYKCSILVTVLLDVTVFGAGIPNIIVAAQNLQLFGSKMTENNFDLSYCYWMLIIGIVLCPFLWFGSPKDMKALCFLSVIVVFLISFMIWICMYNDDTIQNIPTNLLTNEEIFRNVVIAYGILTFQFDIHPILLTIQVDLIDKSKITYIVFFGFLVTTFLFTLTTIFAGLKYGLNTYSNILQGLPPSFLLYITVLLVTMQLCLTCAIGNSALYQHIEDYFKIPRDFNYKRCLIRSFLTAFAVFVAESVPRFDLVMSIIGGTLTGPLVFIFPPLFYIKLLYLKKQYLSNVSLQTAHHIMYHSESVKCSEQCFSDKYVVFSDIHFDSVTCDYFCLKLFVACLVICFGVFATCTTTYLNFIDVFEYASFSPPCLFNTTN